MSATSFCNRDSPEASGVAPRPNATPSRWTPRRRRARTRPGPFLTESGFQYLGDCTLDPESTLGLEAKAPSAPGVYSFVVDDIVLYVGLTLNSLRTRFDQYRYGHEAITTALDNGCSLEDVKCAAGHSEPGTTKLYDRRVYNSEKSASFFATY